MSYGILFAGLFLAAMAFAQPPDTVWTRTYDVPGSEDDALALAADAYGNVFLFGQTTDTSYYNRFVIIKYGFDGTPLLTRYTPNEFVTDWDGGIAVDRAGNIVVAYPSHDDYLVAKYTPDLDTLWTRRFKPGQSDYPYDVACDRSGNIIVTGRSRDSLGDWDYLTMKYSSSGDTLWTRRYDSGNSDWARSIAIDTANGVVICGVGESNGYGYLKYDSLGNLLWGHPWPGEDVYGVAIEPKGGVLLAGSDSTRHLRLMRCNPEGNMLWVAGIGVDGGCGTSVCSDDGGILVTGVVNESMCLAHYDTLGNQAWSVCWRDSLEVSNSALCIDAADNVVVAVTNGGHTFANFVTVIKYATGQGVSERRAAATAPAPLLLESNPCRSPVIVRCQTLMSSPLELTVCDATGRRVRVLSEPQTPVSNPHSLSWDGRDEAGRSVPAGTYLLCWKSVETQGSTALVLLR